jgi:photosystem II stability/assembly factor-like uncharacterized protein
MLKSRLLAVLFILTSAVALAPAQQGTLYMSVLNSRRHRLAASDNPMVGMFVSTDGGRSWTHQGWREYIRTFYTEAGPDGVQWSACGNGVLRSTDHGSTWRITTGWEVTEVLKVKVRPDNSRHVAAATAYGVITSRDAGATWRTQSTGMKRRFASDVVWVRGSKGILLAATEEGVYRSADGGASWSPSGLRGKGIRVVTEAPVQAGTFWAGTEEDGVFLSTDGGATWHARSDGLAHRTVYSIAVDPSDARMVYAGTFGGGVYKSTDAGLTWSQRTTGLTNPDVHSLVILPSTPSTVFAGTLNGGLFVSTDGGSTWQFNSQEDAQVWGLSVGIQ